MEEMKELEDENPERSSISNNSVSQSEVAQRTVAYDASDAEVQVVRVDVREQKIENKAVE